MSERIERELDAALAGLARDVSQAAPRPGRELGDAVLAEAALTVLVREASPALPRPGPDLVARVLADAATVVARNEAARAPAGRAADGVVRDARAGWRGQGATIGLLDRLFGWRVGGFAALALALALGLGAGLELERLPVLDPAGSADSVTLALLDMDFPGVNGL